MSRPEVYLGKTYKPLEWEHDLTKGERSYLREQGIRPEDFSKLDSVAQNDWKGECKDPYYEHMRNHRSK